VCLMNGVASSHLPACCSLFPLSALGAGPSPCAPQVRVEVEGLYTPYGDMQLTPAVLDPGRHEAGRWAALEQVPACLPAFLALPAGRKDGAGQGSGRGGGALPGLTVMEWSVGAPCHPLPLYARLVCLLLECG
jgi:hypothetical protein